MGGSHNISPPAEESKASFSGKHVRHKRASRACDRCRMKKSKCGGVFPCKRCKDDGLICNIDMRKKIEYKQLPRGYAESLETIQSTLIATIYKLYSMVRNSQSWEMGEPEMSDSGQPIIHDIARKLGCIRPYGNIYPPVQSLSSGDENGIQELVAQLEEQQQLETCTQKESKDSHLPAFGQFHTERTTELDKSCQIAVFGSYTTLSPQAGDDELDPQAMLPYLSPQVPDTPSRTIPANFHPIVNATMPFLNNTGSMTVDLRSQMILNQSVSEPEFIKPDVRRSPKPDMMKGTGDPMIHSSHENETSYPSHENETSYPSHENEIIYTSHENGLSEL